MKRMRLPLVVLSLVLAVAGCGGSETPAETPTAPTAAPPEPAKPAVPEAKPEPEKFDVDFVEAKPSPEVAKPPRVTIDVPGFNQFLPTSLVANTRVRFKVQGFADAPEGSYLQFVLDGKPFRPVTDPNEKIMLSDIAGSEGLADGEHIIAAFMSRPNQESIKSEKGIAVRRFFVGKRAEGGWDNNAPMLILGSPHGTVTGDPIVDFFVLNATISGSEYSVRTVLTGPGVKPDGIQRVITDWKPWIVLSARDGAEYKVELQLLDPKGEAVPYGAASRTFTFKRP